MGIGVKLARPAASWGHAAAGIIRDAIDRLGRGSNY
jgi:hypothetical protein